MQIAITGATGFIGKRLVLKHLEYGDNIRILTRKDNVKLFPDSVSIYHGDLSELSTTILKFLEGVDILYHCAAEINDDSEMYRVNVEGTKNLIEAAKYKVKHWVQLSSTGAYGPISNGEVYETQKLAPVNTYERTKVEADKLVAEAANNTYFTYSILRPSNVFGPDMKNQSLFQLVKAVDKGFFFYVGPKGASANYVPVDNVVHALTLLGRHEMAKGKTYNLSDTKPMESFIKIIANCLNKPFPTLRIPLSIMRTIGFLGDLIPGSPLTSGRVNALSNRVIYKNQLIENELGYQPVITMEKCLSDLIKLYKSRF